jgi:hypothetical protein
VTGSPSSSATVPRTALSVSLSVGAAVERPTPASVGGVFDTTTAGARSSLPRPSPSTGVAVHTRLSPRLYWAPVRVAPAAVAADVKSLGSIDVQIVEESER